MTTAFVTGLRTEARILRRTGCPVAAGGGTTGGALRAATAVLDAGATALISFGFAGGLDPALPPGSLVIASGVLVDTRFVRADPELTAQLGGDSGHACLASLEAVTSEAEKLRLYAETGCSIVDMESGAVATLAERAGVPFAILRAVCDPAERDLPEAALAGLSGTGEVALSPILRSILRHPFQIPALIRLSQDARAARAALQAHVDRLIAQSPRPTHGD